MADSKGKKVWGVVRIANDFRYVFPWFYKLPWIAKAVATLSALVLLFIAVLNGMPWPVLMFCALTLLFLIVLFATALVRPPAPEKQFQVELVPHGENSSEVYLEVWNKSGTVNISAQIWVSLHVALRSVTASGLETS
jgi:hypothetical protein